MRHKADGIFCRKQFHKNIIQKNNLEFERRPCDVFSSPYRSKILIPFFYRICREHHQLLSRSMGGTVEDNTSICIGFGCHCVHCISNRLTGQGLPPDDRVLAWRRRVGETAQQRMVAAYTLLLTCSCRSVDDHTLLWRRNEEGWTPAAVPLDLPSDTVVSPSMSIGTCTVQNSKRRRNHSRNLTLQLRCHAYHIYCLPCWSRARGRSLIPVTSMLLCSFRLI